MTMIKCRPFSNKHACQQNRQRSHRGVVNSSGTACHVSSALILLCHALHPIRKALILAVATDVGSTTTTAQNHHLDVVKRDEQQNEGRCTNNHQSSVFMHSLACFLNELVLDPMINTENMTIIDCDQGKEHDATAILSNSSNNHPVDFPVWLYSTIQQRIGLQVNELGDAITALVKILQVLREDCQIHHQKDHHRHNLNNSHDDNNYCRLQVLSHMLDQTTDVGRVVSIILGERKVVNNNTNIVAGGVSPQQRRKQSKSKSMMVPFSLPDILQCSTLEEAIQKELSPKLIKGYRWKNYPPDEFSTNKSPAMSTAVLDGGDGGISSNTNPDDDDDECWVTTKLLQIKRIPPLWLIHLPRFEMIPRTRRTKASEQRIQIPLQLHRMKKDDWTTVVKGPIHSGSESATDDDFTLTGGILYVVSSSSRNNSDDDEGGHYVTIIRSKTNEWSFINDDEVVTINSDDLALELFAGYVDSDGRFERQCCGSYIMGILLVYECHQEIQMLNEQLLGKQQQSTTTRSTELIRAVDWTRPNDLVGRRLHVQWNKQKKYPGTVASYNAQSGKHRIQYDDGDCRDYFLWQKRVDWDA